LERAVSASEDVLSHYQHVVDELRLVTGSKGVFDVRVNGKLIFSKHELGRHAKPGEVLERLRELIGPDVREYGT
jgi:selenoprotein W-related protein